MKYVRRLWRADSCASSAAGSSGQYTLGQGALREHNLSVSVDSNAPWLLVDEFGDCREPLRRRQREKGALVSCAAVVVPVVPVPFAGVCAGVFLSPVASLCGYVAPVAAAGPYAGVYGPCSLLSELDFPPSELEVGRPRSECDVRWLKF